MSFSAKQIRLLRKQVHPRHLRSRETNGRELTYIEGWHAIDEANRIFGFDGWDRETVESRCISARETHGVFRALYLARVRISVRAEGVTVVREGSGTGEARAPSFAEAHDMALKSAETDATKRALATFGRPFGLALHLKVRTSHSPNPQTTKPTANSSQRQPTDLRAPKQALRFKQQTNSEFAADAKPRSSLAPRDIPKAPARLDESSRTAELPLKREAPTGRANDAKPSGDLNLEANLGTPSSSGAQKQTRPAAPIPSEADPIRDDDRSQIDKSVLALAVPRRYRDKAHLQFVATRPCLICSRQPSDAHHLRFAQPRALGRKVSDEFTVPLCRLHHREIHQSGKEQDWWQAHGIDPLPIASELWSESRSKRFDVTKPERAEA